MLFLNLIWSIMMNCRQNTITKCNQMMTMLDSLPISILVLNSELKLLGINRAAQTFLKIQDLDSCCGEEQMFVTDRECMRSIIKKVQLGIVVSNIRLRVRKFDKSVSLVELFAQSYSNTNDVFLFTFFELSPSRSVKSEVISQSKTEGKKILMCKE